MESLRGFFQQAYRHVQGWFPSSPTQQHTTSVAPPTHRAAPLPAPVKDKLIISLLPGDNHGVLLEERYVTTLTNHPEQVRTSGGDFLPDFVTTLPQDIDLVRVSPANKDHIGDIIKEIDAHVKKHGKLSVLNIVGHGHTNTMALGPDAPTSPTIDDRVLLKAILVYQKTHHVQVADKIILGGCNVMDHLTAKDANIYNHIAAQLHCKIEGSTISVIGDKLFDTAPISGLFAVFDGSHRVKIDQKLSQIAFYIKDQEYSNGGSTITGLAIAQEIERRSAWIEAYNRLSGHPHAVNIKQLVEDLRPTAATLELDKFFHKGTYELPSQNSTQAGVKPKDGNGRN